MSNRIFAPSPTGGTNAPKGITWSVNKTANWSTIIQRGYSGRETRSPLFTNPIWDIEMSWNYLYQNQSTIASAFADYYKLQGFYNNRQGTFDNFLYLDPTDNSYVGNGTAAATGSQFIGIANGVQTQFQLYRDMGDFNEIIQNGFATNVYLNTVALNHGPQASGNFWYCGLENLLQNSQAFNLAPWVGVHAGATAPVITPNATTAPDGTNTADQIAFPTVTGGQSSFMEQFVFSIPYAGVQFTFSIWLKTASGTANINCDLNDDNGNAAGSTTFAVTSTWTRFTLTATFPGICLNPTGAAVNFGTFSAGAAVTVFAWQAQLERWASATDPVPTTTAPAQNLGIVTFATAPAAYTSITVDENFYYRVRFDDSAMEFENFASQYWKIKSLKLKGSLSSIF